MSTRLCRRQLRHQLLKVKIQGTILRMSLINRLSSGKLMLVYCYISLGFTFFFFIMGIESLLLFTMGLTVSLFFMNATMFKTQHDKLQQANEKLEELNGVYQDTVEHIMSNFRFMDSLEVSKSSLKFAEEITHSLKIVHEVKRHSFG